MDELLLLAREHGLHPDEVIALLRLVSERPSHGSPGHGRPRKPETLGVSEDDAERKRLVVIYHGRKRDWFQ
jgi:hypothetical protein